MTVSTHAKTFALFLIVSVSMSMNNADNVLARAGIDNDLITVLVVSSIIALLLIGRSLMLVGAFIVLCLIANMPTDFSLNLGFDRDYATGIAIAMVLMPMLSRLMD